MKRYGWLLIIIIVAPSSFARILFDVSKLVGQSRQVVRSVLGEPRQCNETNRVAECFYPKGSTTVYFVNNHARWIRVQDVEKMPYSPQSLADFGLAVQKPDKQTPMAMVWNNYNGYKTISFRTKDRGKTIDSAYFEAKVPKQRR